MKKESSPQLRGDYLAAPLAEHRQQRRLAGREFEDPLAQRQPLLPRIEEEAPHGKRRRTGRRLRGRLPSRKGAQPHDELAHGEGLAQVVVAARLEAPHHILGGRAG